MVDLHWVDSSTIEQVGYDEDAMELHVVFTDGARYVYQQVPLQTFEQLLDAPSKGSFLNRELRGVYDYRRE